MTSRRSPGRSWRNAATTALGLALAGAGALAAPTPATAAPAVATTAPATAAAAALPTADILDLDHADPAHPHVDHAAARPAIVRGAPTQAVDPTLDRTVTVFDGVDDAVVFALADAWKAETQPNITQSVSLECTFRFDGTLPTTAEKDVCSGKQSGGYTLRVSGGNLQAQFYVGGAYQYAAAPIVADTWYHAVATYDGTAVKLYVNGTLAADTPVTGTVTPPPGGWFGLGADTNASGGAEFPAPVSIATARIYSQPLTATAVKALADDEGLSPQAPEPDVLDVDFPAGVPTEHVASMPATTHGAPTYANDPDVGIDGPGRRDDRRRRRRRRLLPRLRPRVVEVGHRLHRRVRLQGQHDDAGRQREGPVLRQGGRRRVAVRQWREPRLLGARGRRLQGRDHADRRPALVPRARRLGRRNGQALRERRPGHHHRRHRDAHHPAERHRPALRHRRRRLPQRRRRAVGPALVVRRGGGLQPRRHRR